MHSFSFLPPYYFLEYVQMQPVMCSCAVLTNPAIPHAQFVPTQQIWLLQSYSIEMKYAPWHSLLGGIYITFHIYQNIKERERELTK